MATALLGLATPLTGTQAGTWGDTLNNEVSGYLDNFIAGSSTISLSASNVLLTAAQARNQMLVFTGALLANVQISPDAGILWNGIRCIQNNTTGSFSITLTNGVAGAVIPQGRIGLIFIDATYGVRFVAMGTTTTADTIPAGYVMPFFNGTPPLGWTQYTLLNDYAIRITSGTGGTVAGTIPFSTLFSRVATDSYTLGLNDVPAHYHYLANTDSSTGTPQLTSSNYLAQLNTNSGNTGPQYQLCGTATAPTVGRTSTSGGGGGHTHAIDMRVTYANMILASH